MLQAARVRTTLTKDFQPKRTNTATTKVHVHEVFLDGLIQRSIINEGLRPSTLILQTSTIYPLAYYLKLFQPSACDLQPLACDLQPLNYIFHSLESKNMPHWDLFHVSIKETFNKRTTWGVMIVLIGLFKYVWSFNGHEVV